MLVPNLAVFCFTIFVNIDPALLRACHQAIKLRGDGKLPRNAQNL